MPRLKYVKVQEPDLQWAEHVRHTSQEALDDHVYVATVVSPDGEVAVEAVFTDRRVAEWYVGKTGQLAHDEDLHDLAAEAAQQSRDDAEAEIERIREAKEKYRREHSP